MSVKLGIAPIAWSNDDMPELGGDTSLETCLSEAREAGFTGIESGGKFPKTSKELLKINLWNQIERPLIEEICNYIPQIIRNPFFPNIYLLEILLKLINYFCKENIERP